MQFQDWYATICGTLCLPLFLLAAWGMSYRSLSKRLEYRIPLSVQACIPAIRKYWMWDLAVSGVAFAFFFLVLPIEYLIGQVFQQFADSNSLERTHAVQPVPGIRTRRLLAQGQHRVGQHRRRWPKPQPRDTA